MKFGKQFETEINAAGVLGDRVPWIDYGCVPMCHASTAKCLQMPPSSGRASPRPEAPFARPRDHR